MRVLLVDDNLSRMGLLCGVLRERWTTEELELVCAGSRREARESLLNVQYDLVVLDIVLPERQADPPSKEVSLALLQEICSSGRLRRPRKIVGLTAYSDAREYAAHGFEQFTWTVVQASDGDVGWIEQICNCVVYLASSYDAATADSGRVDVLWITALRKPELEAVRRIEWDWSAERPVDDVAFVSDGRFLSSGRHRVRLPPRLMQWAWFMQQHMLRSCVIRCAQGLY